MNRRELLKGALGAAAVSALPKRMRAQPRPHTRLILLGTGGGPTPKKFAAASSQVILVDDVPYVVDCGNGVGRQLALAGVPVRTLRHIFITHQHSDHNADFGTLVLIAWASGLTTRVDLWGPPPIEKMTGLFLQMQEADIRFRIADEGRVPLAPLIHAHDLKAGGLAMQDERVKVTAALVEHPLVVPAFAYRFDGPDRSIVISGDTTRSDSLVKLARGADVLVHEAMWLPAVDTIAGHEPTAATLKKHLLASHTAAEDCGRVAQAAGVRTLVLSHLVPGDGSVADDLWIGAARKYFDGRIVVGKDLMEL
jgi:ribonuclease BN (tRNA processing enzyme)